MRPWVSLVLAMSLDGKLSPGRNQRPSFPSEHDRAHLETEVSRADAVLLGAGTLRAYSSAFLVQNPELLAQRQARGQDPQPLAIIASRTLNLPLDGLFFRQPLPRAFLTGSITPEQEQTYAAYGQILKFGDAAGVDFAAALEHLKTSGINHLTLLGGGQIVAQFFAQGLVDELWLTLCPVLVSGTDAPTPTEGASLNPWPRGRLVAQRQIGDELFLCYHF